MCGRFVVAGNAADLVSFFDVTETIGDDLPPSYNIAPTDEVRMIRERLRPDTEQPVRQLVTARWGLIPAWSKEPKKGPPLINARRETVTEKPSFRTAASKRRGIIVADGYYEWQKTPDGKIPTYLHGQSNELLAFAALYDYWPDPALPENHPDKWLRSCTIITAPATDSLGEIHDRTPVIVPRDLQADWLNPTATTKAEVQELLDAIPEPVLVPRVVGAAVGSVKNNGPQLIEPARQ